MSVDIDTMKNKVNEVKDIAIQKTGEVLSKARDTMKIGELKGKIRERYQRLGEVVYEGTKREDDISEAVKIVMDEIDSLKEELEKYTR